MLGTCQRGLLVCKFTNGEVPFLAVTLGGQIMIMMRSHIPVNSKSEELARLSDREGDVGTSLLN